MFDFGDPIPLSVSVKDSTGALANATTVVLTVTLPDGTTSTPAVTNASTGVYTATGPSTQAGRHGVRWVATGLNASAYTDAYDVDEAAPTGIVSLADVRESLKFTVTTNDEKIRRYIDAATDFVEGKIGPVVRRTIVEKLRPQSGLLFTSGPIISLTTMTDTYGYGQTYNVANFLADGSVIYPLANTVTVCYPVTVTYVGGRVIVPAQIRQAALDYIAWRYEDQRGPTALPLPGEYEVQAPATVPFKILQALEPYMPAVVA